MWQAFFISNNFKMETILTADKTAQKIKLKTNYRKMLADSFTPVSVYRSIRDRFPKSILLESSDYHSSENSFSFICFDPLIKFEVNNNSVSVDGLITPSRNFYVSDGDEIKIQFNSLLDSLITENLPFAFPYNGFFGYMSYDMVKYLENIQVKKNGETEIPDMLYHLYRYVLVINHFKSEAFLFEHLAENEISKMDEITEIINNNRSPEYGFSIIDDESAFTTEAEFLQNADMAINHCKKGNVFQIVLSRRFKTSFTGDELNVYRALRSVNPSPYLFYFDAGDFKLIGSSPEAQLVIKNRKAEIYPVAGTFIRTGDDEKDSEAAIRLKNDPKENAEHVMLVDLARNDLSCNGFGVSVEKFREVQFFSHVIHLVSKVCGTIKEEAGSLDVMISTFPAGTLSGAPKIKAMQLIEEIENHNRNFYGGCIGFIGMNGNTNHAILIRTLLSYKNELHYQAGAGIVESSNPESELREVNNKLAAVRKAIQYAQII